MDLAELADELRACLTRLGLAHPEVTLAPVRHIERHDSGKLKRFLPL